MRNVRMSTIERKEPKNRLKLELLQSFFGYSLEITKSKLRIRKKENTIVAKHTMRLFTPIKKN